MKIKTFVIPVFVIALLGMTGSSVVQAESGSSLPSIRSISASLSVGNSHSCALNTQGFAFCWGNNDQGQLGNGTKAASYSAVPVTNGRDFIAISANGSSTCALSVYKTVWCWGANFDGGLGNGTTIGSTVPVQVVGISTAIAISNLGSSACALREDQTVWCWGWNYSGQLGNGTTTSSNLPVQVSGITSATAISGKGWQVCALLASSSIKCWGNGEHAQLGNNTMNKSTLPVSVSNLSGAIGVAANSSNSCALLSSGTVSCWGKNADYVIGHNRNRGLSLVPEANPFVNGAQSIALGTDHACVLLNDGSVSCWGGNFFGQLGNSVKTLLTPNGLTGSFYIPQLVAGLSGAVALDSGPYTTCALLSGGNVSCWGSNYGGKLGNGEVADSSQPVSVMGINGFVGASTATTTTTTTTTTLPRTTISIPPTTNFTAPPSAAKTGTKPILTMKKALTAKSLATQNGLKVASGSAVSLKVSATSRKICRATGTTLKALKKGTCRVTVTVKSRTGKKSSRNLTLIVRT